MNNVSDSEAIALLDEICGVPGISPETELGTLGLDSLMFIEWVSMLEQKLDAEIRVEDLEPAVLSARSISQVLDVLRGLAR